MMRNVSINEDRVPRFSGQVNMVQVEDINEMDYDNDSSGSFDDSDVIDDDALRSVDPFSSDDEDDERHNVQFYLDT